MLQLALRTMARIVLTCALLIPVHLTFAQQQLTSETEGGGGKKPHEVPWYVTRFKVTGALYVPWNNTNIQVNGTGGRLGTEIDFEDDLGFNNNSVTFLGNFQWRISRRSRLDASYYRLYRNSDYYINRDISFKDETYNVNSHVHAFFNTDIFRVSYGYAFVQKEKFEIGASIGAHIVGAQVGIGVYGQNASLEKETDYDVTAPLPNFGIWGGYAFSPKWAVNAEFNYLALTIDDYHGRILAGTVSVLFQPIEHLQVFAGFTGLNIKVDAERDRFNGTLKWGYNGPMIGASYVFGGRGWR
ncbi:hypothetical protein LX64_03286 [Chitinophaga skermanii]|uniref:Outer membrane protein with beta-barrel domain n=1 Tax=Chitinophaga skermanii TaxID=331697 RepID=A0A327QKJ0_9BACT|nr:hypothetical protein [Chitinophaga skermanii]RAJ02277.1 hypothetical protein LX64_03286 [Chitinophaga skermanii]